ncbi:hypothetical protein [Thiocapsa sp.]|uniref:hypothetical protein n=1 Tax=Thiocapsa sp. TaxID=2024551 RepID=UPI001BD1195B|nr:hypothetical protein [Thiocapsa sp.]
MAAQSTKPDSIVASPELPLQPPIIAYQTKASSAPVIRHKRRRLTAVAGSTVPRCAVCDNPAVTGEALCAQHSEDVGLVD